jgi:rhodanese-related sulfurtransferase
VSIDELLAQVRSGLRRVDLAQMAEIMANGGLVVDTRPVAQRLADGHIPGALIIDRNVLEWRLDPASVYRHPAVGDDYDRPVVVVCNEGYSSSLAAATLQLLGLRNATDLIGGFKAWAADGRPIESCPDELSTPGLVPDPIPGRPAER